MLPTIVDGPWPMGINSLSTAEYLQPGQYQWAVNVLNKGGVVRTRPGFRAIYDDDRTSGNARGMTMFTPKGSEHPVMVVANNGEIRTCVYPYEPLTWNSIEGYVDGEAGLIPITLQGRGSVSFEVAVKAVTEAEDGSITALDEPYPILMISDGISPVVYWDGVRYGRVTNVIASHMKWIGNRLWVVNGNRIRASNLLDPLSWTEEDILAEGGYFVLPDEGTGLGVTPDFKSLLAFTDFTTTSFQAGILNRATWFSTPEFQKVVFANIGCAAPKTIVGQFGMLWWMSHNGLTALDSALQSYRSSKILFKDQNMAVSKNNMSPDISRACAGVFDNYLFLSVPSGDIDNYHTWVMDESILESLNTDSPPTWVSAWTGIKPVQWVTVNINGKSRCFAYSNNDPNDSDTDAEIGEKAQVVWEVMIPDSRDVGYSIVVDDWMTSAKDIQCYLETRLMGESDDLKKFDHAEIEVSGITDTVRVRVSYAGKRGVYKEVLDKTIVASRGGVTTPSDTTIPERFENWISQKRYVATVTETLLASDSNPKVEKPYNKDKDTSFSLLIQWTGKMSICRIKMYLEADAEHKHGVAESNETTARYVTIDGSSETLGDAPVNLSFDFPEKSGSISTDLPRWYEERYNSLT